MNINSPNDLYRFLIGNGLTGICQESQNLVACMDVLTRMCSCDPADAKQAKYGQCVQHYIAFVGKSNSFAATLLQKANDNRITFNINNQIISSIHR